MQPQSIICPACQTPFTPNRKRKRFCSRPCILKYVQPAQRLGRIARPLAERFYEKVDRSGDCWEWTSTRYKRDGRAQFKMGRKTARAAPVAWLLASGSPVPPGYMVCHACDNPGCVRNDEQGVYELNGVTLPRWGHLFLGVCAENHADRNRKGRVARGERNGTHTRPERVARGERVSTAKLTREQVGTIRDRYAAGGISQSQLAREYGVGQSHMSRICRGESWRLEPVAQG